MRCKLITLVALAASCGCDGCRQPLAPCATTSECLASEVCLDQRCRSVCNSASDCPLKGETCSNGACLPAVDGGTSDASAADANPAAEHAIDDRRAGDRALVDQAASDASTRDTTGADRSATDRLVAADAATDAAIADSQVDTDGSTAADGTATDSNRRDGMTADQPAVDSSAVSDAAPHCNNGVPEVGEVCDDGLRNSDAWAPDRHCNGSCSDYGPYCGDGIVDSNSETCDDGPANSGAWSLGGHCNATCSGGAPRCGDGSTLNAAEQCDDGNSNRFDDCAWCVRQPWHVDTGQIECANNDVWISSPTLGVSFFGQDPQYGQNLQALVDNGDSTVTDLATGLTWDRTLGSRIDFSAAESNCASLVRGPYTDWRLPTIEEWIALLDYSDRSPPLNNLFNFGSDNFWSSTAVVATPGDNWIVELGDGMIAPQINNQNRYACVRGPTAARPPLLAQGQCVIDPHTALLWQKEETTTLVSWQSALAYCQGLELDSYVDWRLPDVKELASLQDHTRRDPAINTAYFTSGSGDDWSATTLSGNSNLAWVVGFGQGRVFTGDKQTASSSVRCVREWLPQTLALPDTGQTRCYGVSGTLDCALAVTTQLPRQDAQFGANAQRFALGATGDTVEDLLGQLEWQATSTSPRTFASAADLCRNSNTGGHRDWRLPRVEELRAIVDYGRTAPAVSPPFNVNAIAAHWSQTPEPRMTGRVWTVLLTTGESVARSDTDQAGVLCVRGGWWRDSVFAVGATGVVDQMHQLAWEALSDDVQYSWQLALGYCTALTAEGRTDWRLPNIKELASLLDLEYAAPAVRSSLASSTISATYWSSTSNVDDTSSAWQVEFSDGSIADQFKTASAHVRCVHDLP